MATIIGPAVTNENANALVSLEFSKEFLKPDVKLDALTPTALKTIFEHARERSNEVFKAMKPSQRLTVKEIEDRANSKTIAGDLPDGVDELIGRIILETSASLASCVILVQTTYESAWEFALCVIGNAELSFYAIFDAKRGVFERCKSLDHSLREYLEKVTGIYYRAIFVEGSATVGPAATVEVPVKKEPKAPEPKAEEPEAPLAKKDPPKEKEEKKKPAAANRKRPAPTATPTAAAETEQKKQASAPPPPPAVADEK